jgi:hypothetical protein
MTGYTYIIYERLGTVVRSDGVTVSPAQSVDDPNFVEYQNWIAAGNEPTIDNTTDPNDVVIRVLSPLQIRLALNQMGIRSSWETQVTNSTQNVKDFWSYAISYAENDPLLLEITTPLNVNVNDLFTIGLTFNY